MNVFRATRCGTLLYPSQGFTGYQNCNTKKPVKASPEMQRLILYLPAWIVNKNGCRVIAFRFSLVPCLYDDLNGSVCFQDMQIKV